MDNQAKKSIDETISELIEDEVRFFENNEGFNEELWDVLVSVQ